MEKHVARQLTGQLSSWRHAAFKRFDLVLKEAKKYAPDHSRCEEEERDAPADCAKVGGPPAGLFSLGRISHQARAVVVRRRLLKINALKFAYSKALREARLRLRFDRPYPFITASGVMMEESK